MSDTQTYTDGENIGKVCGPKPEYAKSYEKLAATGVFKAETTSKIYEKYTGLMGR